MHVKAIRTSGFRRFTDLTINQLPSTARLVVLAGPNGTGKSSLFDAFRTWATFNGNVVNGSTDEQYFIKAGSQSQEWHQLVAVEFHEPRPTTAEGLKKAFYFRSAYRNDPDFAASQLSRVGSVLEEARISRFIENDAAVARNYQRLVAQTIEGVYSGTQDTQTVKALRDAFLAPLRDAMVRTFGDLVLEGPGDPLADGSFFFQKGTSKNFHYKNLSGGEKAAFDLLLDLLVRRTAYNDSVYCIDEPETHLNTRLQAALLDELFRLVPESSQLWIATHSIGMLRKARDLHDANPGQVVFLDFENRDFDAPVVMQPAQLDRDFWHRTLGVALDDLAKLVAPTRVVLCEGRPVGGAQTPRAEFDARCYRQIFAAQMPDTDFISVGNSSDVLTDRVEIGKSIQTIVAGTSILRVVDRDDRSPTEIADLEAAGVRVLGRRHLEAYLLDDEMLEALCNNAGQPERVPDVLQLKQDAVAHSVSRGNAPDDIKSASGEVYTEVKRLLGLVGVGNSTEAFLRDVMAPLVSPTTATYAELRSAIFGP